VNPKKPDIPKALDKDLSLEDTGTAHARINSPIHPNTKAAYVREVEQSSGKSKSTGDLRALSKWIAKQREIAELKGESVRVRTKKKR
jgi:hypothetical protein